MIDQLHPSSFVEVNPGDAAPTSCFGPRNIRNQPSRETPGILLQEKYIPNTDPQVAVSFNLPFRNSIQQIELLKSMYGKLDPEQQSVINQKIADITEGQVNLDSGSNSGSDSGPLSSLLMPSSIQGLSTSGSFIPGTYGVIIIIVFVVVLFIIMQRNA
jgi:hypothetical protein